MTAIAVLAVFTLLLFAGSYFSKRRFGLLGLALAAGYVLSFLWHDTVEFMVSASGLVPAGVISSFAATVILLLLPSMFLFFHGVAYKTATGRLVGSFLFTFLALGFLAVPMSKALVIEGAGLQVFGWFTEHADLIVGVGVMAAVLDMFISKSATPSSRRSKK